MKRTLVLLIAAALLSVSAPAAIILIDDFDNDDGFVTSNSNGVTNNLVQDPAGVLGGRRELIAQCQLGCSGASLNVTTAVEALRGNASFDTNVNGIGSFLYEGAGALGLGGGVGQDLTDYSLAVDVIFFNPGQGAQAGTQARVTLSDGLNSAFVEHDILGVGSLTFTSAAFLANNPALNPATILSIRLDVISANESPDVGLDNFVASNIPEPATYAMLGAGLVGLALLRRRVVK